jgi:hypothetical protein
MRVDWNKIFGDKKSLRAFKVAASTCYNLQEFAAALSKIYSRKVTADAVQRAYSRHFATSIVDLFKVPDYVEQELKQREQKDKLADLKNKHETVLQELKDARAQSEFLLKTANAKTPPISFAKKRGIARQRTAVALASDWHVEEVVDSDSVNGRNEYNLDIAEKRIRLYFENVAGLIEHHRKGGMAIDDLVLWLGGDLMTGYIHEELEESNELSPTETVLFLIQQLTAGIEFLAKILNITVVCNYGNHGRTTKKRRIATGAKNSYEWMMYHLLAQRFAEHKSVTFKIAEGDHVYADIYKFRFRFTHGDNFKYGGGVGGLSVPILKGCARLESFQHADYTCMGHFHQLSDLGNVVVNGSLIGYSPYAVSINAPYEPPQQAFFLVDPDHGKCMSTPIWVEE